LFLLSFILLFFSTIKKFISKIWREDFIGSSIDGSVMSNYVLHKMFWDISWFMTKTPIWMPLTRRYCEVVLFLSEVKGVTVKFFGDKSTMYFRVTLYWGYLIVLWLFHLVCILYCVCFNLFCNVWVCVCVGFVMCVLVICVLVFTVFCIVCTVFLYCFVYVYLFLFVLSVLV
jgi:hypothetical protein